MSEPAKSNKAGRWKAGESGNPKGRPAGTGDVARIRDAMAAHVPGVLQTLVMKALEGDIGAARLLLERTVAPLRAIEPAQPLSLPNGSLTDQGRAVLRAVASGQLAPGQGTSLLRALGALARVTEIDELTARIEALEAASTRKGDAHG